ncbi:MAG: hypothetical protein IJ774_13130 [Selenomonadaceae bacterium]|nr:hypothetical protein [Selenomonadaceae bacterium]
MKHLVFGIALICGLLFAQLSTAQAADYYVGTSDATGMECYLMTDTIVKLWTTETGKGFSARLKMVGKTVQYLDYELVIRYNGTRRFKNSAGYSGEATPDDTPIEWNMCQYVAKNRF